MKIGTDALYMEIVMGGRCAWDVGVLIGYIGPATSAIERRQSGNSLPTPDTR